ncbi:CRISPR-associated protein Cas4 [Tardisphaera saccharovorans]
MKTSEDEEAKYIPVKWIENYTYCPRKIYFLAMGLRERQTEFMKEGKEEQEGLEEKERRRGTVLARRKEKVKERWFDVPLRSEELGLVGQVDMVIEVDDGLIVVDFKDASGERPTDGFVYQTATYSMMAEQKFGKQVKCFIVYYTKNDKAFELLLTDSLRRHVNFVVKRMKRIVSEERVPSVVNGKRCVSCGFRYVCKGR